MRYPFLVILVLFATGALAKDNPNATKGLPAPYLPNEDAPPDKGYAFQSTQGMDTTGIIPRVVRIEHRDDDTTAAIVGIEGKTTFNGESKQWFGTGFFIDECHVATAGHVASYNGYPADTLTIGWGARPKATTVAANFDLAANFSHLVSASLEWIGTSALDPVDMAKVNAELSLERQNFQPAQAASDAGKDAAGDWAILRVKQCRSRSARTLSMPKAPHAFVLYNYGQYLQYWAALGYPGAEFDRLTVTRCAVAEIADRGARTACKIRGGNSGGPLLGSLDSTGVAGITSYADDTHATFIPAGTPGFAALLGPPKPPTPGCITKLKAPMLNGLRKIDPTAQADEHITKPVQFGFFRQAVNFARQTGAAGSTIIPPIPDPFWCSVFDAIMTTKGEGAYDPTLPIGEWHYSGLGLKVERIGNTPKVSLNGKFFMIYGPMDAYDMDVQPLGRRILIHAVSKMSPEIASGNLRTVRYRWTIDFIPGRPPLFASFSDNYRESAVLEWFLPGPSGVN